MNRRAIRDLAAKELGLRTAKYFYAKTFEEFKLTICFAPSLSDSIIFLTLTRLVVVIKFVNFRFALFTPL